MSDTTTSAPAGEKPNLLDVMHTLGPRPISAKEAEQLAQVGQQNAREYEAIDTLVTLARMVEALKPEQRRELAQRLGMDAGTYNEVLFRANYLARSSAHGRTSLERDTSRPDEFTLAGERKASVTAYDQGDHRRAIVLRVEDDGSGPTVRAYAQLIDVRGFVITAETPAATLELKYDQVTSPEALNDLLVETILPTGND